MAQKYTSEEIQQILAIDDPSNLTTEEREIFNIWNNSEDEDVVEEESEFDDEVSITSTTEDTSDGENSVDELKTYSSKSGVVWSSNPPRQCKRQANNILKGDKPGLSVNSKNITSVAEAFLLFIPVKILEIVSNNTNLKAERSVEANNEKQSQTTKNWKNTSITEIKAFIAILIAAGKLHSNHVSVAELWASDPAFCQPFFSATMSRTRFQLLCSLLRFDDSATRQACIELKNDKLQAIRYIFDIFSNACVHNFVPHDNLTVDERLATYRGHCSFRVYMKSKPGRHGIKIWICADSKTAYVCNLQVYTGMVNKQREVNQGMRVVMDLVEPYFHSGRGITTDKFFTSVPLAQALLEKGLTLVGTLRDNKREIPHEFYPSPRREVNSSLSAFTEDMMLTSYVPKKNKSVILLSTQHHSEDIVDDKPQIIHHYNETKGGVDTGDMMTQEYTCARTTKRWPFRLFLEIIDIAALNAYIIWTHKFPEWEQNNPRRRRLFLQKLILELSKPYIELRAQNPTGLHSQTINAMQIMGIEVQRKDPTEPCTGQSSQMSSGKRCAFCTRKQDRKTRLMCCTCKKPVCNLHRVEDILARRLQCSQ